VVFLSGFAGTVYGLVRAIRAERQSRLEAETASRISDFMTGLFEINDPGEARGRVVTAKEILDRGAGRIGGELRGQPALQGRLMESMGRVYRSLGLYQDSKPLLEGAVESLTAAHGEKSPEVARALYRYGGLLIKSGEGDAAIPLLERALSIQEATLGPDNAEVGATLNNLGNAYRVAGKFEQALPLLERSARVREKALGPDDVELARTLTNLGAVQLSLKDYPAAEATLKRALAIREKRLPDARGYLERAFAIATRSWKADDANLKKMTEQLIEVSRAQGDEARARELEGRLRAGS